MSTPKYVAGLNTWPREALIAKERVRLTELVQLAHFDQLKASKIMHGLKQAIDLARAEMDRMNSHSMLFPPSDDMQQLYAQLSDRYGRLIASHQDASAVRDGAVLVHESAVLERAWLRRPAVDGIPLAKQVFSTDFIPHSPSYAVTVLLPDPPNARGGQFWRQKHHATVKKSLARTILNKWAEQEQAHILRDAHGRYYVATPTHRLELVPTDIARPHSEGDVLRRVLAAYHLQAYADTDGTSSWLAVPLEPHTSHEETYDGPHVRIEAAGRIDRPASQHRAPWVASYFSETGEHARTFDGVPADTPLAEECAYLARAIAEFAAGR
ncbi:hypothetical protein ACLQ2N_33000 [Streptomyces sp. DT224]|uniref:hypothetical protein n=1 Tax=Streptomyces sp. DT224 TaxID=3393426 RepID=UPI003CE9C856